MEDTSHHHSLRIVIAGLLIVLSVGTVAAVVYVGQLNKSKDLKATNSKASVNTLASSNACELTFTVPTPKPSKTPTPTKSQTRKPCKVSFKMDHQAVCWYDKQVVPVVAHIVSLPDEGPYYLETDWYVAAPVPGPNHYNVLKTPIKEGETYTINAEWPGISAYNPRPETIEIHTGINVRDKNDRIVTPNCTDGLDHYWTPYVQCPNLPPEAQ